MKVWNKREQGIPRNAVYVGRPSRWGNPFAIGRDGSRSEVIEKYRLWLASQPSLLAQLPELEGKDLVCWCAPQACHAEVLMRLANNKEK
jgi:hypothetical protein